MIKSALHDLANLQNEVDQTLSREQPVQNRAYRTGSGLMRMCGDIFAVSTVV